MARTALRLAAISPDDIIAEVAEITDDEYELFESYPHQREKLESAIAEAVSALLPDELIVQQCSRQRVGSNEIAQYWEVLQGLAPGTQKLDWAPLQDADSERLRRTVAWVSDAKRVAEAIDLSALVRAAVREAQGAREADA